ncbi:hypothetical protein KP509_31G065800 [Ceratopteris richardii]|uniref:MYND-type domain-containing protein n=1 Tax=Ceratopteris richardii TaxID=49495 RepID=A0A8T2R086_CERRI|nr:hypothetical protein KP509_31G065800 [Ceratopteris richardii]
MLCLPNGCYRMTREAIDGNPSSTTDSSCGCDSKRPKLSLSRRLLDERVGKDGDELPLGEISNEQQDNSTDDPNLLRTLPEEVLLHILGRLSATASCPGDLVGCRRICRQFDSLVRHPSVLAKASVCALMVPASQWCAASYRYLMSCVESGNIEAQYTLGMISFYCLQERERGMQLLISAAKSLHPLALNSLAIIHFNGSGGSNKDKNPKVGASLCARAASIGHVGAMRELGHCLQDGYGVPRNVLHGWKLLLKANATEAAASVVANLSSPNGDALNIAASKIAIGCFQHHILQRPSTQGKVADAQMFEIGNRHLHYAYDDSCSGNQQELFKLLQSDGCSLLSDFGCNVPPPTPHIAHRFLVEWFTIHTLSQDLRICWHELCGRPETRKEEFRRCSACGLAYYCSRACQALDWRLRHKLTCDSSTNRQLNGRVDEQVNGGADRLQEFFLAD